jgi:hypothetical protein
MDFIGSDPLGNRGQSIFSFLQLNFTLNLPTAIHLDCVLPSPFNPALNPFSNPVHPENNYGQSPIYLISTDLLFRKSDQCLEPFQQAQGFQDSEYCCNENGKSSNRLK